MRVLAACSLGGAGHLQPLLHLLDASRRSRHETAVVGPASLASMVEAAGHPFFAGREPPEEQVGPIREKLPVVAPEEASVLGNRELFGGLAVNALVGTVERVMVEWHPDVVFREPCEYASGVAGGRLGIPVAQVAIGLAEVEWRSIDVAAPALEEHLPGLTQLLRRSPYLTRFPSSLDPSPFPDTRRFREPANDEERDLPDWWSGSTAPLVYVTFGTVLGWMSIAGDVYRTAIEAVADVDARVLLTVGRKFDPSLLGPLPRNVHVEGWVDQADVLEDASVVLCHGGSGTTFGALAAGVPVVVVPVFADQFANSRAVTVAQAGVVVDDRNDPWSIRGAVEEVLQDMTFTEVARRVAEEVARQPSVDALLEGLLKDPAAKST